MKEDSVIAFEKTSLGAENTAYEIIARLDPEYFEKLKGVYVDACALRVQRGIRIHSDRALTLGATPQEVL